MKNASVIVLAAILFSGCAQVNQLKLGEKHAKEINSITVLELATPGEVSLYNIGGVSSQFGLLGALAQAAIDKANKDRLKNALNTIPESSQVYGHTYNATIHSAIAENGYSTTTGSSKYSSSEEDVKTKFLNVTTNSDAILDAYFTYYGVASDYGQFGYSPRLVLKARLFDKKTQVIVFSDLYVCGVDQQNKAKDLTYIDSTYSYESVQFMVENPSKVVDGIKECEIGIAKKLAWDLRKPAGAISSFNAPTLADNIATPSKTIGEPTALAVKYNQQNLVADEVRNKAHSIVEDEAKNTKPAEQVKLHNAILKNSSDSETWYRLGMAHIENEQYVEAKAALNMAVSINPKFPEAYFGLGATANKMNDRDEMRAVYFKIKKIDEALAAEYFKKYMIP